MPVDALQRALGGQDLQQRGIHRKVDPAEQRRDLQCGQLEFGEPGHDLSIEQPIKDVGE